MDDLSLDYNDLPDATMDEARKLFEACANGIGMNAIRFYELRFRNVWKRLGYKTFESLCETLAVDRRTAYFWCDQVEMTLFTQQIKFSELKNATDKKTLLPIRTAVLLKKIETPEGRRIAWMEMSETRGHGVRTPTQYNTNEERIAKRIASQVNVTTTKSTDPPPISTPFEKAVASPPPAPVAPAVPLSSSAPRPIIRMGEPDAQPLTEEQKEILPYQASVVETLASEPIEAPRPVRSTGKGVAAFVDANCVAYAEAEEVLVIKGIMPPIETPAEWPVSMFLPLKEIPLDILRIISDYYQEVVA